MLSPWQTARQLAYELSQATWSSGASVFASAAAVVILDTFRSDDYPQAQVSVRSFAEDPDDERLGQVELDVAIYATAPGSAATVGGGTYDATVSSTGRGSLEIAREARATISQVLAGVGVPVRVIEADSGSQMGRTSGSEVGLGVSLLRVTYDATRDAYYHPVTGLAAPAILGSVSLSWDLPTTRFDSFTPPVVRRASGSTAPDSVTSGTGIAISTTTTASDTPGTGTWSYSVFFPYDEDGSGVVDNYSAATSVTTVVT